MGIVLTFMYLHFVMNIDSATPKYAPQGHKPEMKYMRLRNLVSFTQNKKRGKMRNCLLFQSYTSMIDDGERIRKISKYIFFSINTQIYKHKIRTFQKKKKWNKM